MNRPLTYGEKAVGLTFNPSKNLEVDDIKRKFADIIDVLHDSIDSNNTERTRMLKIAITEAQSSQMWAVKAITWSLT